MDDSTAGIQVATTGGPVRGVHQDGLAVFKGVPYAAAPVGDLRWRPAQPHPGWDGVLDAAAYGPSAPQSYGGPAVSALGGHGAPPFDEDCLTLNVWTPAADSASRPVLIWIHGGGFVSGSGSLPIYAGDTFARDGDLVVVTINYRLAALGYLHFGSEHGGSDSEPGNVWLTDQIAALRWVRDNIAAFGGDPGNITVAGQSGGAFSTAALAAHPQSNTLFHRAILQSPPLGLPIPALAESGRIAAAYLDAVGAKDLDELRRVPWTRLIEASTEVFIPSMAWGHWTVPHTPVRDDVTLTRDAVELVLDDAALDIDILIGWTREEANLVFALSPLHADATREQVLARAADSFGDRAAEVYAAHEARRPGATPLEVLEDLVSHELFAGPAIEVARARATRGRPVWAYRFDYATPAYEGRLAAPHCLELPFVFDNFDNWSHAPLVDGIEPADQQALSTAMHRAWISFIRTGDPNHAQLPTWERYTEDRPTTMRFDTVSTTTEDPRALS
ncbi:carboxylesterase/lipase family protein [Streptacidiphilus sp. PAMC 29251]